MTRADTDDLAEWRDSASARAELESLKAALHTAPESIDARLQLAAAYRERGFYDQAGRWGVVVDGWPSEVELDRLARHLASSGVGLADVRRYLLLPDDAELSPVVTELLAGPTERYRKQFRTIVRARQKGSAEKVVGALAGGFFGLFLLVSLVALVIVYAITLAGGPNATEVARGANVVALVLLLLALGSWALGRVMRVVLNRRRSSHAP